MSHRWLRTLDAAEHLKLSPATLINYRCRGIGPRHSKLGKIAVYNMADLDTWAEAQRVDPGLRKASEREAA